MSMWEEIAVGNGPFGVVVIPVVVPGGTSPVYRITGPQPIGGAIIESGRERAVEIAAELNRTVGKADDIKEALERDAAEQHAAKLRAVLRASEAAADVWMRLGWWTRIDAMAEPARSDFLAGFSADWTPPQRPTDTEFAELRAWIRAYVDRLVDRREWAPGKRVLFIERHVGLALGGSDWDATGQAALAFAGVDLNAEVKS